MAAQNISFSFQCETDLDTGDTSLEAPLGNGDVIVFVATGATAVIKCITARLYSEYNTTVAMLSEYYAKRETNPEPIRIEVQLLDADYNANRTEISAVGEILQRYRSDKEWPKKLSFDIGVSID